MSLYLRMNSTHSSPFKVPSCPPTPTPWPPDLWTLQPGSLPPPSIPEHTHQLCRRQGLTGRSHLEGDLSEGLSSWGSGLSWA